jgi:hypothetical protein
MDSLGVVFLGVIALSSLVQAAFLVGLARGGRRMARRLDELQERIDGEIRPALQSITRISRNLAEISDIATLQARRLDEVVTDTLEKVQETTNLVRHAVLRPLGPLMDVAALLKGLRRGLDVYRQIRGLEAQRRGSTRRYAEDEHLFI